MFSERRIRPELLDSAALEDARVSVLQIARLNRLFGGHGVIRKALEQVAEPSERFSLLDVGAASGDTARLIREVYPNASIVSLDCKPTHLEDAPAPKIVADAFALPFPPETFDYVFCSLFLHHFDDSRVTSLLSEFYSIARKSLVVCDLERHVLPYLFMRASKPFCGWSELTVHDGLISVRASFSAGELLGLAKAAGMRECSIQVYRPAFRISLIAKK